MERTLFYLGAIFVVLNIFTAITTSNITLSFINILVAIGLFLQLLTYNCFKQYREEIKNIYLRTLQWIKK